jgi:hypothetical protein
LAAKGFPPEDVRLFVILGAYGSGKTEFAVNFALRLAADGKRTALADLDIVNPYFRSREKMRLLEEHGVQLIAPAGELAAADLPVVPAGVFTLIQDRGLYGVMDIGGDASGARVLAAFAKDLGRASPAVWYVLNRSRYDNADAQKAQQSIRQVGMSSGLSVTGLISNTHLIAQTTADTLRDGAAFAREVSELCGIPIACHAVRQGLVEEMPDVSPVFPMRLTLRRPWEDESD